MSVTPARQCAATRSVGAIQTFAQDPASIVDLDNSECSVTLLESTIPILFIVTWNTYCPRVQPCYGILLDLPYTPTRPLDSKNI